MNVAQPFSQTANAKTEIDPPQRWEYARLEDRESPGHVDVPPRITTTSRQLQQTLPSRWGSQRGPRTLEEKWVPQGEKPSEGVPGRKQQTLLCGPGD